MPRGKRSDIILNSIAPGVG